MEVANARFLVASKSGLRYLAVEHGEDLLVGNVAHLVVVLHDFTVLIANATIARLHQSIAGLVLGTHIAVDSSPALVAFASVAGSNRSVFAPSKRAASCSIFSRLFLSIPGGIWGYELGSRQSSPPNPSGHSHFPLYSLHSAY